MLRAKLNDLLARAEFSFLPSNVGSFESRLDSHLAVVGQCEPRGYSFDLCAVAPVELFALVNELARQAHLLFKLSGDD
jgi:hypothetical protein